MEPRQTATIFQQQHQMAVGHSRSFSYCFNSDRQSRHNRTRRPSSYGCGVSLSATAPEVVEVVTVGARSPIPFVERPSSPALDYHNGVDHRHLHHQFHRAAVTCCSAATNFASAASGTTSRARRHTQQAAKVCLLPQQPQWQQQEQQQERGAWRSEVTNNRVPLRFTPLASSPDTTPTPSAGGGTRNGGRRSTAKSWYRRICTPPLDGVSFTLLGVSVWLKTPGVDPLSVARALLHSSVDLRTRNARGMTPLHLACAARQEDVARVLLLAGADPLARDRRSRCPLQLAAISGSQQLVLALLASGADPNKASDSGTTPLHNAALHGHVEVARTLLLAGAIVDVVDKNTFSPLYLAAQNGHKQVVLDLLVAGADASIATTRGFTPLHVAARCGRLSVLRTLLDARLPVDSVSTPALTTPLHLAAGFSRAECVQELLNRGADAYLENQRGCTPLDLTGSLLPFPDPTLQASSSCDSDGFRAYSPRGNGGGGYSGAEDFTFSGQQGEKDCARVRQALLRAQAWQRRRTAVLLCDRLRKGKRGGSSHSGEGGMEGVPDGMLESECCCRERAPQQLCSGMVGVEGEAIRGWVAKRGRWSWGGGMTRDSMCGVDVGSSGSGSGEGRSGGMKEAWVIERLSVDPNPNLMRHVIGFL